MGLVMPLWRKHGKIYWCTGAMDVQSGFEDFGYCDWSHFPTQGHVVFEGILFVAAFSQSLFRALAMYWNWIVAPLSVLGGPCNIVIKVCENIIEDICVYQIFASHQSPREIRRALELTLQGLITSGLALAVG